MLVQLERLRAAHALNAMRSRQVFTTSRCSQVANCASPRNCFSRVQTFTSDSCAGVPRLFEVAHELRGKAVDARRVALDQRVEGAPSPFVALSTSSESLSFE
jgi:hypothetical protein